MTYIEKYFQKLIDKINGKIVDIISLILYSIIAVFAVHVVWNILQLVRNPILKTQYSPTFFALLIVLPILTFYLTLAGDYFKKPFRRIQQFIFCITTTAIFALGYLVQMANIGFVRFLFEIDNIDILPANLLEGNIRLVSLFLPLIPILPIFFLTLKLVFDKKIRKDLIEFELDFLLPTVHEMDDTTIDLKICEDVETGKPCIVPEKQLYGHIWLQGGTGSGKTATVIRPLLDQLFHKKAYLKECQKKLAYEALKEGIAELTKPVSNEWFNENFSMKLIKPKQGREEEFKAKFKKFIRGIRDTGEIIFKDLGVTVIAPDGGLPQDTVKIAESRGIKVYKIDPKAEEIAKGNIAKFNPLKGDVSPEKLGDIISSILVRMEQSDGKEGKSYFTNASVRAVRNVVILLKVMYPRLYGCEPVLTDVLNILNRFDAACELVERMKEDEELRNRWKSVIDYFETSFYPPETDSNGRVIPGGTIGSLRKKTEEAISGIINQLDNFLGREEVRYILCDREESLDLKEVLENGDCIAIATRQNDLGERLGKAFALFFILSLQNEVLSRYSEDENPEIPHFLIIDEFPFYVNDRTKVFFTFARKYRCSVTIAIQNMGQLKEISDAFGETIFTNTDTKILLPKSNVEDRKYWAEFFGTEERFEMQTGVTSSTMFSPNPKYTEQRKGAITNKQRITEQEINNLHFKEAFYSYTNAKGRQKIGKGNTDFLDEQKLPPIKRKFFDFEAFNPPEITNTAEQKAGNSVNIFDMLDNAASNQEQSKTNAKIKELEERTVSSSVNSQNNLNDTLFKRETAIKIEGTADMLNEPPKNIDIDAVDFDGEVQTQEGDKQTSSKTKIIELDNQDGEEYIIEGGFLGEN
ncbi:MAG: type IV secretory system conjugative DNA transfer family protein [Thermosipho sp. (in: Bacteria)]|nr:type IV secretory system conjugative DNA transfer family protein [Thermosipho sp. (in: thermotogales)]